MKMVGSDRIGIRVLHRELVLSAIFRPASIADETPPRPWLGS